MMLILGGIRSVDIGTLGEKADNTENVDMASRKQG